jgi:hypothetical protein
MPGAWPSRSPTAITLRPSMAPADFRLRGQYARSENPARRSRAYCGSASKATDRNFAYLSPIFRASLYCAEARQARTLSRLSN